MSDLQKVIPIQAFNDNLFNNSSLLRNNPSISNYGSGTLSISDDYTYTNQAKSIELNAVQNVITGINESFSIKDAFTYTAQKTGQYCLSFRLFAKSITDCPDDYVVTLKAIVKIAGIDAFTMEYPLNLSELDGSGYFTLSQFFNATTNDALDLRFELQADTIGTPNPDFTINFSGFKLEFDERQNGYPTEYSLPKPNRIGIYDYNNTLTAQSFVATDIKVLNNGLGVNTNKLFPIDGIADIFDTTNNVFAFSKLELGDTIGFRIDSTITTTSTNQNIEFYLKVGVGSGSDYNLSLGKKFFKTIGAHSANDIFNTIYIGNTITKDNDCELYFTSDDSATMLLTGFAVIVNKRS